MRHLKKSDQRKIDRYRDLSLEQLQAWWDRIGRDPETLVRSGPNKGLIKTKEALRADEILFVISYRRSLSTWAGRKA